MTLSIAGLVLICCLILLYLIYKIRKVQMDYLKSMKLFQDYLKEQKDVLQEFAQIIDRKQDKE